MTTTINVSAGQQQTIGLDEGQALNIIGATGAAGVAYRLDPVLGGTNSLQSWAVGTGALAQIGPFAGAQKFLMTCSVGTIAVTIGSAVLGSLTTATAPDSSVLPVGAAGIIDYRGRADTFAVTGDSIAGMCMSSLGTTAPTASRSGGVVSVNFGAAHFQVTGNQVVVRNLWDATGLLSFDGVFTVTRTGANTLTWADGRPDVAASFNAVAGRTSAISVVEWQSPSSWWGWLNAFAGGGLRLLGNFGWGGAGSADIATLDAQAIALNPAYVLDISGINDINSQSAAQVFAAKKVRYIQYLNRGIQVVSCSILPLGAAHTWFNATNNAKIIETNRLMQAWCAATNGMIYADIYSLSVDPVSATPGAAKASSLIDTIHPSTNLARAWGRYLNTLLGPRLTPSNPKTRSNADNFGYSNTSNNIYDTAPWVATAGGSQGGTATRTGLTVATGMTVTATGVGATCTGSPVARADGQGYDQVCVFTPANSTDSLEITAIPANPLSGRAVVGDVLSGFAELALSGVSGSQLKNCTGFIQVVGVGGTVTSYGYVFSGAAATAAQFGTDDFTITLPLPKTLVHDASNYAYISVKLQFAGAGTAITMKLGLISVLKNAT